MKTSFRFILALVLALAAGLGRSGAQSSSGVINGRLVDESGGAVVTAQVQLVNQATGEVLNTKVQVRETSFFWMYSRARTRSQRVRRVTRSTSRKTCG